MMTNTKSDFLPMEEEYLGFPEPIGSKGNDNKGQKKTLSIDPKCLSCSNDKNDLMKSFKLACLSYKPNTVCFRNIEFERD